MRESYSLGDDAARRHRSSFGSLVESLVLKLLSEVAWLRVMVAA